MKVNGREKLLIPITKNRDDTRGKRVIRRKRQTIEKARGLPLS